MKQSNVEMSFSGKKATEIVGISYRQLDYWTRTELISPSIQKGKGSGSRRRYSYKDLLELRVIKNLIDGGIKVEKIREIFDFLKENLDQDVTKANLVISGNKTVLVKSGDELIDILQKGQGVLNILPLATVKEEIDSAIVELRPADKGLIANSPERAQTGS
ncbi:MAG: MerR family transcriptional regulator [Acidimicrobiaceae bacterium]|jgi:DNA-binding transcriptional MerR regulator|nr:MerR family transcriptional regulator [Acidimicrobiaceae bacterium]|tara:strand:- start:32020 stop:32502 length:483 start_codon:yes stop_codon:yes gene_type:complete